MAGSFRDPIEKLCRSNSSVNEADLDGFISRYSIPQRANIECASVTQDRREENGQPDGWHQADPVRCSDKAGPLAGEANVTSEGERQPGAGGDTIYGRNDRFWEFAKRENERSVPIPQHIADTCWSL